MRKRTALLIAASALALTLFAAAWAQAAAAIAWGSTGSSVTAVQKKLKQWGYYNGSVDGVYGQSTYNAVTAFQRKNGLKVDGVVGASTAAAMGVTLSGSGSNGAIQASGGYSSSETEILARIIHGEARGEPYIGKVAVAAVVLNRVRNAAFPNTVAAVVYQSGAFDAVSDGQIWLTPNDESWRAARDAMNGWDPTYGCLYYFNPQTATNAWIWSREVRLKIGRHWFAI
ncbi:MAG: spore cortex-lytic enzyme [Oscillospiraceae bacterium]|jgi:N-acetylmuramoyl-L-alanine amidase|nr:spore cortex-lytic enzyme [Oscillospiraceae bacterium]